MSRKALDEPAAHEPPKKKAAAPPPEKFWLVQREVDVPDDRLDEGDVLSDTEVRMRLGPHYVHHTGPGDSLIEHDSGGRTIRKGAHARTAK